MICFISPHPPIIIDQIGDGREREAEATIDGMKKIAKAIAALKPKVIAVITPHGNVFGDALCINIEPKISGDFGVFGHPDIRLSFSGSPIALEMAERLSDEGIPCVAMDKTAARQYRVSTDIDHGALVPLWFVKKEYEDFQLIHINIGFLSVPLLYRAGQIIADMLGDDNVLILSGDLSHRLKRDAPAGYDEMGKVYDKAIVDAVRTGTLENILLLDEGLVERAGQCAQKPLELFTGCFEGYQVNTEIYSYEGPFGVGYMTARVERGEESKESRVERYLNQRNKKMQKSRESADAYVRLARETIESYVTNGIKPAVPQGLDDALYQEQKGAFVSIKKHGRLRGCIGTIEPVRGSLAEEIIENAVSAATRDPRFHAITIDELPELDISVDVLFPPEGIDGKDKLDEKEYGVIVSKGFRRGLLLPNLEGVNSVDEQISIALDKAGIRPDEKYDMQRFKVIRHR